MTSVWYLTTLMLSICILTHINLKPATNYQSVIMRQMTRRRHSAPSGCPPHRSKWILPLTNTCGPYGDRLLDLTWFSDSRWLRSKKVNAIVCRWRATVWTPAGVGPTFTNLQTRVRVSSRSALVGDAVARVHNGTAGVKISWRNCALDALSVFVKCRFNGWSARKPGLFKFLHTCSSLDHHIITCCV